MTTTINMYKGCHRSDIFTMNENVQFFFQRAHTVIFAHFFAQHYFPDNRHLTVQYKLI